MVVVMRARGADREDVPVQQHEQEVANCEDWHTAQPTYLMSQLRQEAKQRNTEKNAAAEWNHRPRAARNRVQVQAGHGAGDSNREGCRRLNERRVRETYVQDSTLTYAKVSDGITVP